MTVPTAVAAALGAAQAPDVTVVEADFGTLIVSGPGTPFAVDGAGLRRRAAAFRDWASELEAEADRLDDIA